MTDELRDEISLAISKIKMDNLKDVQQDIFKIISKYHSNYNENELIDIFDSYSEDIIDIISKNSNIIFEAIFYY